jgi:hypothetical protein
MNADDVPRKAGLYLLLLVLQISGAIIFIWRALPEFRQVAIDPGTQLPRDSWSNLISFGVLCVMQISFWCRISFVRMPSRHPNAIHLPDLDRGIDIFLIVERGVILSGCLFALFCTASKSSGSVKRLRLDIDRALARDLMIRPAQRARRHPPAAFEPQPHFGCVGTSPSCCMMARLSVRFQVSTMRPSASKRCMSQNVA